jgi:hypothetical protein
MTRLEFAAPFPNVVESEFSEVRERVKSINKESRDVIVPAF